MLTESDSSNKESALSFRLRGQQVQRPNTQTSTVQIRTERGNPAGSWQRRGRGPAINVSILYYQIFKILYA